MPKMDDEDSQLDSQLESTEERPAKDSENVRVMIRCRPLLAEEQDSCIQVDENENLVHLGARTFKFDAVFGPETNDEQVYMRAARPLVESAFAGYECAIFLYGQTGTGKTFTHSSLTRSAFGHLFSLIRDANKQARYLIRASYYELYNEQIRDLLTNSGKSLELHESKARGVYVKDLTSFLVNNQAELDKLKRMGDKRRAQAATKMNEHSSRSHSIFTLTIETLKAAEAAKVANKSSSASKRASALANKSGPVCVGRLNLIDLAGSERQSKSASSGKRLKEASRINLSLTCLSLVIRALTDPNQAAGTGHIPYRNSKLTRLLSSSLGGNSKTLLIACLSPAKESSDETLNTILFACRTKRVKNTARINEDPSDALLRRYRRQVEELRLKLKEQQQGLDETNEEEWLTELKPSMEKSQSSGAKEASEADMELVKQLRLLKAKIIVGGENLLEKAEMHERLLEASRSEIEEKRKAQLELQKRLERKLETIDKMSSSKDSLESQRSVLEQKLKRALVLQKQTKEEVRDLASEQQQLKESLLQTIRAISKETKHTDCVIEDFIPRDQLEFLNACAHYDEQSDEWQIKYIALSGNNIAETRRVHEPVSNLAQPKATSKRTGRKFLSSSSRSDPFIRLGRRSTGRSRA